MTLQRLFLLIAALALPAPALAADAATEQTLRAALVFNFIKFTEWPAAADGNSPLRVCLASGDAAQMAALDALDERRVRGIALTTARFRRPADCDVIYVDSSQRWKEIAEKRTGGSVLTIGGYAGFADDGGMVEISLQEGKARFDINLLEAKRAGLRFYPQLLRLARRIVE